MLSSSASRALLILGLGLGAAILPFIPVPSAAQNFLDRVQSFDGQKVTSVLIQYRGTKTVNETRLRSHMATAPGKLFSQTMLDGDTRSLYTSGLVDDVQFFAESDGDGVKITAEVVTRPLINGLGFDGNTIFDDGRLAKDAKLSVGQVLSDRQILAAVRNIEQTYQGFGYPDVSVTHRLQATARAGYADLVFIIGEGVKNEVRNINFEGNNVFKDTDLRREMVTKEKGLFSFFTKSGRIDSVALDEDIRKVEDFYRSKGYWRATVGTPTRIPVKDGRVDLMIPVQEGQKYIVNSVSFPGMKVFTPAEINPALTLISGIPYSSKKMRDDIRMIRSYYGSRGYADANVVTDVRAASAGLVNISYRITPGGRYKVGRVNVDGNTKSQDRVIRRELPMNPGENFNSVDLETAKRRLQNLNYFNNVQVTENASSQSGYRDVNILVQEKRTGSINFGLGLSSIDNVVGFITLEQENFNLFNPWNFTGAGQRFSMTLRAGAERKDFRVSLTEPWFMGRKLSLGTELYYRDLLFLSDEYDQTDVGAAVFLRKPLGQKAYLKAQYRLEDIEVTAETAGSFFDQNFAGDFLRSSLSLQYVYDSRDSNVTPREGEKIEAGVTLAGGVLGGDVDTLGISFSGAKHWNFAWDTILTARAAVNVVDGYDGSDEIKDIPIFERQFLGGQRDLRGFEFRDIGLRDGDTGEVYGGATSVFASLECSVPLVETVRGAVFYDVGFVNEASWDFGGGDVYSDAGFGVRMNLPGVGPLAVDYAIPINSPDPEADNGGQFNFYLNYQF